MRVDLKKLRHAVVVAQCGSLTRAAEELCITQPSLSRSIATLEEQWGVRIFERGRMGIIVTPVGRLLLEEAEQLLAAANTLDHNMKLRSMGRAGSIDFGMTPLAGAIFMASILQFLCNEHPDLKVSGVIKPPDDLLDDLKNEKSEFAIYCDVLPPEAAGLVFTELNQMPVRFLVRAGHPLAKLKRVNWEQLSDYTVINTSFKHDTNIMHWERHTLFCDSQHVARDVMLKTEAIWVTSPWLVHSELAEGAVRELQVPHFEKGKTSVYLVSVKNRSLTPAAELVIAQLKNVIERFAA